MTLYKQTSAVSIGIDAGVVAPHQVAVRGAGITDDFRVSPTLAGMAELTERLSPYAGALVVAEPTAGTWLPLSVAVTDAGCRIGSVANRDSARLRRAIRPADRLQAGINPTRIAAYMVSASASWAPGSSCAMGSRSAVSSAISPRPGETPCSIRTMERNRAAVAGGQCQHASA
jgi:hypothetical protein